MADEEEIQIGIAIDHADGQAAENGDVCQHCMHFGPTLGVEFVQGQCLHRALPGRFAAGALEGIGSDGPG